MTSNHLADETLQAFLLREMPDDTVVAHLEGCAICRERLADYQHLMAGIQQTAPESFAFDVTTVVMDRIAQHEKQESQKQELIFWGLLTLIMVFISAFAIPFIYKVLNAFNAMPIFTTLFIMGTGLAVLLFLLADINRQSKLKERKIFENKLQPII